MQHVTDSTGGSLDQPDDGYVGRHYAGPVPPAFADSGMTAQAQPSGTDPYAVDPYANASWNQTPRPGQGQSSPWSAGPPASRPARKQGKGCFLAVALFAGLPLLSGVVSLVGNLASDDDDGFTYQGPTFDSPTFADADPVDLEVGDRVRLRDLLDTEVGYVTLEELDVDLECTLPGAPSAGDGSYLGLRLTLEVDQGLDADDTVMVNPYDMELLAPDGQAQDDPASDGYLCVPYDQMMPFDTEPGESVTGWVVLRSETRTGTIHWDPAYDGGGYLIAFDAGKG